MPFYRLSELRAGPIGPEYSTAHGPVLWGDHLEIALVDFKANKGAKPHQHPNEQMMYVLRGRIRAVIGGEEVVAGPGDIIHMPADVEHQVLADGEDTTVISCKNLVDGKASTF